MIDDLNSGTTPAQLGALVSMPYAALRAEWRRLYGTPPPKGVSRQLLVRAIAYEIQANQLGGLQPATERKLQKIAGQLCSGDGRANQGAEPAKLRDQAVAQGITINGLAILNEDLTVADYYRAQVIGGEGAFIMTANDYESYAQAILTKLLREIAGALIAVRPDGRPGGSPGTG